MFTTFLVSLTTPASAYCAWPGGRRRDSPDPLSALRDASTGQRYQGIFRMQQDGTTGPKGALLELIEAQMEEARMLEQAAQAESTYIYSYDNEWLRRIIADYDVENVGLQALVDTPEDLAQNVAPICEDPHSDGLIHTTVDDITKSNGGEWTEAEKEYYAHQQKTEGVQDTSSNPDTPFVCMHDHKEFEEESQQLEAQGYVKVVTTGLQTPGEFGSARKIGRVHEFCHTAMKTATDEKRLCHTLDGEATGDGVGPTYIYEAKTKHTEETCHVACHTEDDTGYLWCHPLRDGDIAFLKPVVE